MAFHDEVEIEGRVAGVQLIVADRYASLDFEYDEESETYYWPCPCGDRFQITKVSRVGFYSNNKNTLPVYFRKN